MFNKVVKQLIRKRWTSEVWYKSDYLDDMLERDIYKRARVVGLYKNKGTGGIEIDRTIIHVVHDTRDILSILNRFIRTFKCSLRWLLL